MSRDTPEGKVTKKIIAYLKALKKSGLQVEWLKIHGSAMQRAGEPDLDICINGLTIKVEIKAPGGTLTRLQSSRLHSWAKAGARTAVVESVEAFEAFIVGIIGAVAWRVKKCSS